MLYNLREYHRPTDLAEALRLLRRTSIRTVALAGGVSVVGEGTPDVEAVVDLDGLGLDFVEVSGSSIRLGATTRLQSIVESLGQVGGGVLAEAARRMAGWHVRNAATVGGALAGADGDSPLSIVLTVLDGQVTIFDGQESTTPWVTLAAVPASERFKRRLITAVSFSYSAEMNMAYEQVARTPADYPIVCAAALVRPGSPAAMIVAVGGVLERPLVERQSGDASSMLQAADRILPKGVAGTAYRSDFRGSADYRRSMGPILARRAVNGALVRAGLLSE